MLLILLFLVAALQLIIYSYADKKKIRHGRILILFLILIQYAFVFPFLFTPSSEDLEDGAGAFLPSVFIGFWVLGGGITLLVHVVYVVVKSKNDKGSAA